MSVKKSNGINLTEQILDEKNEIDDIDYNIKLLKERLLEKTPVHFSFQNVVSAFFGALIIGLTFVLKGALISTAIHLDWAHVIGVIIFTNLIIFSQVYFISYNRIKENEEHSFGEFIFKRMISLTFIAFIVSVSLVYVLAINTQLSSYVDTFKVITVLWMCCSIGSAIPGLLNKY